MAKSSTIANLGVAITANVKGFNKGLKKAVTALKDFAKTAAKSVGTLALGGVAALTAGFVGLTVGIATVANSLSKVILTAAKLGMPVQSLQALQDAAKDSNVEVTALNTGMQRMVRRVAEAANGSGEAVKALQELGLDAKELNKLQPQQQILKIGQAMRKFPRSDQIRLAMKLFDTEGVGLVNLFDTLAKRGGGDVASGLNSFHKALKETGRAIETPFEKPLTEIPNRVKELLDVISGFFINMAQRASPGLEFFLAMIKKFLGSSGLQVVIKLFSEEFGTGLSEIFIRMGKALNDPGLINGVRQMMGSIIPLIDNLPAIMGAIVDVGVALFKDMGRWIGDITDGATLLVNTMSLVLKGIVAISNTIAGTVKMVEKMIAGLEKVGEKFSPQNEAARMAETIKDNPLLEKLQGTKAGDALIGQDVMGRQISESIDVIGDEIRDKFFGLFGVAPQDIPFRRDSQKTMDAVNETNKNALMESLEGTVIGDVLSASEKFGDKATELLDSLGGTIAEALGDGLASLLGKEDDKSTDNVLKVKIQK